MHEDVEKEFLDTLYYVYFGYFILCVCVHIQAFEFVNKKKMMMRNGKNNTCLNGEHKNEIMIQQLESLAE